MENTPFNWSLDWYSVEFETFQINNMESELYILNQFEENATDISRFGAENYE